MSRAPWKLIGSFAFVAGALVAGCGDDDEVDVDETTDTIEDVAEDVADEVQDAANTAWASFETNFERLMDEVRTGDSEAQEELLENCRDTLQDLREANDDHADELEDICDRIQEADDESAWDELREEIEQIEQER